jgi:hypothetical protein
LKRSRWAGDWGKRGSFDVAVGSDVRTSVVGVSAAGRLEGVSVVIAVAGRGS